MNNKFFTAFLNKNDKSDKKKMSTAVAFDLIVYGWLPDSDAVSFTKS